MIYALRSMLYGLGGCKRPPRVPLLCNFVTAQPVWGVASDPLALRKDSTLYTLCSTIYAMLGGSQAGPPTVQLCHCAAGLGGRKRPPSVAKRFYTQRSMLYDLCSTINALRFGGSQATP